MATRLLIILALLTVSFTNAHRKSYDGYRILEVSTRTASHASLVRTLQSSHRTVEVWQNSHGVSQRVYIMTPPDAFPGVMLRLRAAGMTPAIYNNNVQEQVDSETFRLLNRPRGFNYSDFNAYEDIMTELDSLATRCNFYVTCSTSVLTRKSVEGRDLKMFHMSTPGPNKEEIWVDATMHAREWLSTATTMQFLRYMVTKYGQDGNVTQLVNGYNWHVLAVANPDGYVYSWTQDRYWRKSRNPTSDPECFGTNLNRNFNSTWAKEGFSDDPCSNTYHGSSAASESETKAIQAELRMREANITAYVTVHATEQMILYPWGYTAKHEGFNCKRAKNHAKLERVGKAFADAMERTTDTKWARGTACETLYPSTGTSRDFARGPANITYAFSADLRGPDFVVEPSEIQVSFREFWAGMVAMVTEIETIAFP